MKCREVTYQLPAYCDDALEAQDREALERHLAGCQSCAEQAASLRRILTRPMAPISVPSAQYWGSILPRLHERIDAKRPGLWIGRTVGNFAPVAVTTGVIALLLLVMPIATENHTVEVATIVQQSPVEEVQFLADQETAMPGTEQASMSDVQELNAATDLESIQSILRGTQPAFSSDEDVSSSVLDLMNDQQLHTLLASVDVAG